MINVMIMLYLADVVNGFGKFLNLTGASGAILIGSVIVFLYISSFIEYNGKANNEYEQAIKTLRLKWLFAGSLLLLMFSSLLPSKQTVHLMLAVSVGSELVDVAKTNELLQKSYDILNLKLDDVLKDAKRKRDE